MNTCIIYTNNRGGSHRYFNCIGFILEEIQI